jgi:o-succinylbenzoate---CoA ligase
MRPPLYIHRYRLPLRADVGNALSARRVLAGFLIRSGDGFGCVHPWPELGDPDVDELIRMLGDGKRHRLLERAMACVAEDEAARCGGRSVFAGLLIPQSHATITGDADFPAIAAAGFRTVKLKTHGSDPALQARVAAAAVAGLKIRIDCSGTGTAMLAALLPWAESIEFIEDPEAYHVGCWREIREELKIPLALDRLPDGVTDAGGYDVRVLKPALETCEPRVVPVVITSYMDHPLGQMFAAWEAARYPGRQLEAGLLTHTLFEPDAFTEAVKADGPQLLPPEGTGLGFYALLDELTWERLPNASSLDCGSPLPLSNGRGAAGGEKPPNRQLLPQDLPLAAKAAEGCRTPKNQPWESPGFWERDEPLLLTNPRAPLGDPPRELPAGALVFATSGSTGAPSLVCLSRAAMLASAEAVNGWLGATGDDVWLRVLPVFHVGGMSIYSRAALTGSRVVCSDDTWDPLRFTELAENCGATLTSLVPAQVHDLVSAGCRAPLPLRTAVVGGGAISPALFRRARALAWPILPSYGLTEASSQVATARPGTHISLPPLELLPCWEARTDTDGRLQLRGTPLLSGRLVCTASGWTMEPALDRDGWFTTRDRAVLDGRCLTITGRCDRMVKVLGELVDLDAIEAALAAAGMPPDRGAVIARSDVRAGNRPWLVTDLGEFEATALVAAANASLPPFAGIAGCHHLPDLPRSPLGKILRGELESRLYAEASSPDH